MKLIDDFTARLEQNNLPRLFCQCFVIEDWDRTFVDHPFDYYGEGQWGWDEFKWFYEDCIRKYQFNHKKTTSKNHRVKQEFFSCFDVELVGYVWQLYRVKRECEKMEEVRTAVSSLTDKSDASVRDALKSIIY